MLAGYKEKVLRESQTQGLGNPSFKIALSILLTGLLLTSSGFAQTGSPSQDTPPEPIHVAPAPATELTVQGESLEITSGGKTFKLVNKAPTPEAEREFNGLSSEEKEKFLKNRSLILTQATKALSKMRVGFGTGKILNNEIRYQLRKSHLDWSLNMIRQMPDQISFQEQMVLHDFYKAALDAEVKAAEERAQKSFREYGNELIQGYLEAIDKQIWSQSPLVANSNEFGIIATGGIMALGGYRTESGSRGLGGLYDIGFSLGINTQTKATVFQIIRDFEKFKSTTMPATGAAGLFFKVGVFIANHQEGRNQASGTSFYPPMIPTFTSSTPQLYIVGANTTVPGLAIPPSPISDAMTYTNTLSHRKLLRITVSKIHPYYVHVETDLGRGIIQKTKHTISTAWNYLRRIFGQSEQGSQASASGAAVAQIAGPVRCEALF